jgi:signal transduction histidine kinase
MYMAVFIYQLLYFCVQYAVLKRIELLYYSFFLLGTSLFFYTYSLSDSLNNRFTPTGNPQFSSFTLSLQFIFVFLYLLFLEHFLELYKKKALIFYVVKYDKYYNLFFFSLFILMDILKIQGQILAWYVSLLSLPINIFVLAMLWRINSKYSKVVLYGTACNVTGNITYCLLVVNQVNTYELYGGNVFVPLQLGLLMDVFILGYGLSLRAAESDKKLVQTLIENQQIVETERGRLAKDLHDGMGGLLSGIKVTLNSVADKIPEKNTALFTKAGNQLDTAIREMRRVAHNMMPEALLKFGLGEATQDFCDGINESNLVKMKYTQIGSLQILDQSTEIVLYRIIQELTNNALKHAAAKTIFIQITTHEQGLSITVEDDGKGFDAKVLPDAGGSGLRNVAARVDYLKGSIDIKTEKGNGCSITMEVPFFHAVNKSV